MKRAFSLICALFLVACAGKPFKDEFANDKPWAEQLTQLPAYPDVKNLMAFDAGAVTSNQHLVDTTSIKIGEDGVIRFSLVVKSSTDALNVSYEGIRCATSERKLYAGRKYFCELPLRIKLPDKIEFLPFGYAGLYPGFIIP